MSELPSPKEALKKLAETQDKFTETLTKPFKDLAENLGLPSPPELPKATEIIEALPELPGFEEKEEEKEESEVSKITKEEEVEKVRMKLKIV